MNCIQAAKAEWCNSGIADVDNKAKEARCFKNEWRGGQLTDYLEKKELVSEWQYGFRKKQIHQFGFN